MTGPRLKRPAGEITIASRQPSTSWIGRDLQPPTPSDSETQPALASRDVGGRRVRPSARRSQPVPPGPRRRSIGLPKAPRSSAIPARGGKPSHRTATRESASPRMRTPPPLGAAYSESTLSPRSSESRSRPKAHALLGVLTPGRAPVTPSAQCRLEQPRLPLLLGGSAPPAGSCSPWWRSAC